MRLDHIVIHVDNDPKQIEALTDSINAHGYPFDPDKGRRSGELRTSNINIGPDYLEVVRVLKPNAQSWMPVWVRNYNEGLRGAYCIFIEVEDVERTAVALKKAGVRARGPAVLTYPTLGGILRTESPYFIYYLPNFPDSHLQIGLLQYKAKDGRETFQLGMVPNAEENGIKGIRKVEVELPNLDESMDMLQQLFPDMRLENGDWVAVLEKQRMVFRRSPDAETHVRVHTVTSQRANVGKKFSIDNVEVITTGG